MTWPYSTTLYEQRTDPYARPDGKGYTPGRFKNYRWRVETFDGRPRVVAEHQQQNGKWAAVRHPDRLAQLLAETPGHEPKSEGT